MEVIRATDRIMRLWRIWSGLWRLSWLWLSRLCHDRGFRSSLLRPWPWVLERKGLLRLDARLLGMESSPQILAPRLLRDSSQTVLKRETVLSVERRGRVHSVGCGTRRLAEAVNRGCQSNGKSLIRVPCLP